MIGVYYRFGEICMPYDAMVWTVILINVKAKAITTGI